MHIAEGLLPAGQAVVWSAAAAPFVGASARDLSRRGPARMGMVTALVFATTLLPIPIPGLGITSHMCATPVLALLLGPTAVVLPTFFVLLLQALFFSHGGLTTLGANVVTLGVVGPWMAWIAARGLRGAGLGTAATAGVAAFAGDVAVYLADAGILAWAIHGERSWLAAAASILVVLAAPQGLLAIVEGLLSAGLVRALVGRAPHEVPDWLRPPRPGVAAAGLALVLCLGATGCGSDTYEALDDVAFTQSAEEAGAEPADPILDLEGTELGRALYGGAMFLAGLLVGLGWARLGRRRGHPPGAVTAESTADPPAA